MRRFTHSCLSLFLCILLLNCEKDEWIQGAEYDVAITFTGDIDEFDWFLDIDGFGEQAGHFPFGTSSFTNEDRALNSGTTYTFNQGGLDEMSVYFSVRTQPPSIEDYNMSINVEIRKFEFNDDTGVESEFLIINFTKDYQRVTTADSEFVLFKISTTKEVRTFNCEGTCE